MKFFADYFKKSLAAYARLPQPVRRTLHAGGSFLAGLVAALILSYVLYRVALPSKPFIYVAF